MAPNAIPYAVESLDLFSGPFQQVQVEREYEVSYSPSVGMNASSGGQLGQIVFDVHKTDAYIDLSNVALHADIQIIKKDGTPITNEDKVSVINNILDSAFSDITVQFNGKSLVLSRHNYPFLAYICKLINFQHHVKKKFLKPFGWVADTTGHFDAQFTDDNACLNQGLVDRRKMFADRPDGLEMITYLQIPLSNQAKYLVSGVDLKFTFTRSTDAFMLMGANNVNVDCKFIIRDMKLFITKIVPAFGVISSHHHVLNKGEHISHFYKQAVLKTVHLHQGVNSYTHEFTESKLPVNCLVGIVTDAAAMGSGTLHPYKFSHHGLSYLSFYHDGISYPNEPYQIDVAKGRYLRVYNALMKHINSSMQDDRYVGISQEDFVDNCFLVPCDFAPLDDKNTTFSIPKSGNLKCELRFHRALPQAVSVLFFFTVEAAAYIDKDKNIIFDSPV